MDTTLKDDFVTGNALDVILKDSIATGNITDTNLKEDIIIAGQNSFATEIETARGGEVDLPTRLNKSDSSLATTTKYLTQNITFNSNARKPLISFIDDDSNSVAYSRLFPLFQSKGMVGNSAVITGLMDKSFHMTSPNLVEMYSAGWEFLSHTYSQSNLSIYPIDADLDWELGEGSKGWLEDRGYKVNGIVYPQGVSNLRIRRFTKKHYTYAFGYSSVNGVANEGNFLDSMNIGRIALGSFTNNSVTVNGNNEGNTFAFYKECVDYAIANNGWLVFMTHCSAISNGMDEAQWTILNDLLDYINTVDIDVVTTSEGYKSFGNKVFVGDIATDYVAINEKGIFAKTDGSVPVKKILQNTKTAQDGLSTFTKNAITVMNTDNTYALANGYPIGSGLLYTHYLVVVTNAYYSFNRQEYWINASERKFTRYALTLTTWSPWIEQAVVPMFYFGMVTMSQTIFKAIGNTECDKYVEFEKVFVEGGTQQVLTKTLWSASEISTDSGNPTVIGSAGAVNLQIYRDADNMVYVKNSVSGNNYPTLFRTSFC